MKYKWKVRNNHKTNKNKIFQKPKNVAQPKAKNNEWQTSSNKEAVISNNSK